MTMKGYSAFFKAPALYTRSYTMYYLSVHQLPLYHQPKWKPPTTWTASFTCIRAENWHVAQYCKTFDAPKYTYVCVCVCVYMYIFVVTLNFIYQLIKRTNIWANQTYRTLLEKQGRTHKRCTLMDPHTFSSYVRIRDVVLKTCLGRWTIGRSGERGSGISVLPARHDEDVSLRKCKLLLGLSVIVL